MTVLLAALALMAVGYGTGLPRRLIGLMLVLLWLAVVLAHLVLPEGTGLLRATGGTLRGWLALGVVAVLVLGYRAGVSRLRKGALRSVAAPAQPASGPFSDTELDRYARHIVLREVGGAGQRRLKGARVLVVGAGGLGSPALLYLAAAGVGTIGVIDDDTVSNSNLQRQVIHTDARIGMPKVFSAEVAMTALNPFVTVRPYNRRLTVEEAPALFADYDLILDGSDNFPTRLLVNAAAVVAGKPLISGAIAQWEGQLGLFDPASGAPCYACIFPEAPAEGLAPACAEAGVMGALPGVVGAMMAAEAIKEITGAGQSLRGRLLIYDALWGENRTMVLKRRVGCAVCGGVHPAG
ncbi:HesA/MoeB/ThiF family protein [Frigidibacter sp.]|uniref:HesA/MoeB/ThiF family protein n=1 Tax=Frigidibacter sp. TaxID=2586418 RepID=UPI002734AD04|nr:HesA/MoeB/ThiF family protein [Frigidibacter sp.]MDP3339053.1 HesA/MoeB/ThiF family protein [Frigidibacter sp.]